MTSRPFRNACKGAIGTPAGSDRYLSLFLLRVFCPLSLPRRAAPPPRPLPPNSLAVFRVRPVSRGSAVGESERRRQQPRRVSAGSSRRGNASTPSGDQRESGDSAKPATTRKDQLFPPRDVAETARAVDLLGSATPVVFRGILYEPPRSRYRGPMRQLPLPLPPRPIIKLLYPDFAQTGFAERRCNFSPGRIVNGASLARGSRKAVRYLAVVINVPTCFYNVALSLSLSERPPHEYRRSG